MAICAKLCNSFVWSCAGIKYAFKSDLSFKLEVFLALLLIPLAFWLAHSKVELILLIMAVLIVLLTELINTALETIVDRISLDDHLLSKHAKDLGSAVVFCSLVLLVVVWGIICIF